MSDHPLAQMAATLATNTGATVGACLAIVAAVVLSVGGWGGSQGTAMAPVPAAVAGSATSAAPIDPRVVSPDQRKAIEQIVREYLMSHPEILVEMSKELEARQQAQQAVAHRQTILDRKEAIFRAPGDFVVGNPKGDITVVEFFDYNCGWCKRVVEERNKLIKADPNVRIVMKEFPIFGENSQTAAKAAMAAIAQGKYMELHVAMMKERQVTKDNVFRIAEKVGLDIARLKEDMANPKFDAALKETQDIAQALGIEGTPGFIIDTRVNVGFVPADGLKDLIKDVRKSGCQVC